MNNQGVCELCYGSEKILLESLNEFPFFSDPDKKYLHEISCPTCGDFMPWERSVLMVEYASLCVRSAQNILSVSEIRRWCQMREIVRACWNGVEEASRLVLGMLERDLRQYYEDISDVEEIAENIRVYQKCHRCGDDLVGKSESLRIAQEALYRWSGYAQSYFISHQRLCQKCEPFRDQMVFPEQRSMKQPFRKFREPSEEDYE